MVRGARRGLGRRCSRGTARHQPRWWPCPWAGPWPYCPGTGGGGGMMQAARPAEARSNATSRSLVIGALPRLTLTASTRRQHRFSLAASQRRLAPARAVFCTADDCRRLFGLRAMDRATRTLRKPDHAHPALLPWFSSAGEHERRALLRFSTGLRRPGAPPGRSRASPARGRCRRPRPGSGAGGCGPPPRASAGPACAAPGAWPRPGACASRGADASR